MDTHQPPGAAPQGSGAPAVMTARRAPSRAMRVVTRILATEPKLMADADTFTTAYTGRTYPKPAPVPAALRLLAEVTSEDVDGHPVFTVVPKGGGSRWRVLYLHGGGFVEDIMSVHWDIIMQLLRFTGATIVVPSYPLAPENSHREGHAFVRRVYQQLLDSAAPEDIVFMGDSAGGTMAIVQAMQCRDDGIPLPARLVLFSPCVNVTATNPEVDAIEPLDVILARPGGQVAGRWWAGSDEPTIPQVSPLFGDPSGLPPIDIYQGTADILAPDNRLMAQRIAAAGGTVRLRDYPGAIHVFVAAVFTPEAQEVYADIAATLGVSEAQIRGAAQLLATPSLMFTRQVTTRLRYQATPWIQHVGTRARLRAEWLSRGERVTRAN